MNGTRTESSSPTISVVIPAYNAAAFLGAALASVFEQSARPHEIIVVDDGSTDATAAIAASFDVRLIAMANGGTSAARNAGIAAATGEYIAFMDADDVWRPQKLAAQTAALRSYGKPAFSFTDFRTFDERGIHDRTSGLRHHPAFRTVAKRSVPIETSGNILISADSGSPVLYDSYIQPSSVVLRRADFLAVGGFDETLRVYEDHEFLLRLFKLVPAIGLMKPLLLYRRHATQVTADTTLMKRGLFELARRVADSPERYPVGDAHHLAVTEYQRYYRLGVEQARSARFDDASESFKRSLLQRRTFRAMLGLLGSCLCESPAGRTFFELVRSLWKKRPTRR